MLTGKAISRPIFAAFLECETKAYLLQQGIRGPTSETEALRRSLDAGFKLSASDRLRARVPEHDVLVGTPAPETLRAGIYSLILGPAVPFSQGIAHPDALQRLPLPGARARATYRPIRFSRTEKPTSADKLALTFEALAVAEVVGKTPSTGAVIHGSRYAEQSVPIAKLVTRVRSILKVAGAVLANPTPPALGLNKHCPDCEFQARCRKAAIETDDLSLLPTMSANARKTRIQKGILTVTQLSYTFRPPRRRRSASGPTLKHDPALKALAIRTGRVHVVGAPTLTVAGTAVYFDVEGVPDRSFYYLVGLRFGLDGAEIQNSFWADDEAGEREMWASCLSALKLIRDPCLIHYGSYETLFLRRMKTRHCSEPEDAAFIERLLSSAVNLVSLTYAQIYLPTYSNGLKEIGRYLGFRWSDPEASGVAAMVWRSAWELSRDSALKQRLLTYNAEDCEATQKLAEQLSGICLGKQGTEPTEDSVNVGSIERNYPLRFGTLTYAVPDFQRINEAAYWDHQRCKVYLRPSKKAGHTTPKRPQRSKRARVCINKTVRAQERRPAACPKCGSAKIYKNGLRSRIICDLRFLRSGVRLWTVQHKFMRYSCWNCKGSQMELPREGKWGINLQAYVVYQIIELRISLRAVARNMRALFSLNIQVNTVSYIKMISAKRYFGAYQSILQRITRGKLVHADETQIQIGSDVHYVWVFTNLTEVAYIHSPSREASIARNLLCDFKGVLVSDFYGGYDGLECAQQKCLIHLLRDINEDVLKSPFDEEMRQIATGFAGLLKPMVDTIDRRGLKARYLRKHKKDVGRFYRALQACEYRTEVAQGWRNRFQKNRGKLFTFLDHDEVPWNNNNAEHAVKAFARLRNALGSSSTVKGIEEYLVLLSISETCKFRGEDFFGFLRSGAADFAG